MTNQLIFTYQHTCKKGHEAYINQKAPFKSVKTKNTRGGWDLPFLGEGYYFWEENREAAVRWGQKKYRNNYSIVEYIDLKLVPEKFLDFTNRRHLQFWEQLKKPFTDKDQEMKKYTLSQWIEFFKNEAPHLFPFHYIKANEFLPNPKEYEPFTNKFYFSPGLDHYTQASPLLILCVLDKKFLDFENKRIL